MTRSTSNPATVVTVDRRTVLAYRAHAQGLHRATATAAALPALALGVQDSPPGTARLAFSARLATPAAASGWDADPDLGLAWTVRGAPHAHRQADLPGLAAALWPFDDKDVAARLAWNATRVADSGLPPLECLRVTAEAVADVRAAGPGEHLAKGALSAAVTERLPAGLPRWCEPCRATHVPEQLLRLATLPGGLAITGSDPLTFGALPGWAGVPTAPAGFEELVRAYLRLYGPATPADVRTFLGCTLAVATAAWPADAVGVRVDGPADRRSAWALPADVAELADPPPAPDVRLLPPNDAFLKAGDRAVLVPDKTEQKAIWRVLGSPGVLLLGAVPAGIWRPKATARRLDLTVEAFVPLEGTARAAIEREASRLADVRGLTLGRLTLA